jgi:hypothetical protein
MKDAGHNGGAATGSHQSQPWHTEYLAALFETNRSLIATRIQKAEHLIITRERELYSLQGDLAEQRALNNALHALHALRACLGL